MRSYEELKSVDIRTVDKSTLTDIRDVKINPNLPTSERIKSFLMQVSNPYCVIVDGVAVKMSFADTSETINDRMKKYFQSKAE